MILPELFGRHLRRTELERPGGHLSIRQCSAASLRSGPPRGGRLLEFPGDEFGGCRAEARMTKTGFGWKTVKRKLRWSLSRAAAWAAISPPTSPAAVAG